MSQPPEASAPPAGSVLTAWLQWLEGRDPSRIELGLERVKRVLQRLALPARPCPLITVAGTNGKGSVVANLDAVAGAAGMRVGAYLSPHLLCFNERIRIGGQDVEDAPLVAAFERVAAAEQGDVLTYFEFTTLAAIVVMQAADLDLWVLEVGLGGRLDAVNVLDADVAILTSIGLDHTDWLGDTLAGIAREKLGVLRAGKPLVCGVTADADPAVLSEIHQTVAARNAPLLQLGEQIRLAPPDAQGRWAVTIAGQPNVEKQFGDLPRLLLAGPVQPGNAALAITALEYLGIALTPQALAGLGSVRLPGRCQTIARDPITIVDTGHNVEAATILADALSAHTDNGRTHAVLGMLRGKPAAAFVAALAPVVDAWHFCSLPGPRGLAAHELAKQVGSVGQQHQSVAEGLLAARQTAGANGRVLATGSFLTVEAVLKSMSMVEGATP